MILVFVLVLLGLILILPMLLLILLREDVDLLLPVSSLLLPFEQQYTRRKRGGYESRNVAEIGKQI